MNAVVFSSRDVEKTKASFGRMKLLKSFVIGAEMAALFSHGVMMTAE